MSVVVILLTLPRGSVSPGVMVLESIGAASSARGLPGKSCCLGETTSLLESRGASLLESRTRVSALGDHVARREEDGFSCVSRGDPRGCAAACLIQLLNHMELRHSTFFSGVSQCASNELLKLSFRAVEFGYSFVRVHDIIRDHRAETSTSESGSLNLSL